MGLRGYRTGIMVVIMMFLLHIITPVILSKAEEKSSFLPILEDNFKFGDKVDRTVLEGFIYHIKKSDGYKIVFIGDSVVAGATVKNRANTIPANFKELANKAFPQNKIRVYNLAMPGNRQSDIYFTFKKLYRSRAADLIITNVNYAFYSDEMLGDKTIARSDLFRDVMDKDSAGVLGLEYSVIEGTIRNEIVQRWNVYRLREELSFYLFGMNPREIVTSIRPGKWNLKEINPVLTAPANGEDDPDLSWKDKMPFPDDQVEHWVQVFNVGKLDEQNRGFWFLKKMGEDIKKNKINVAAFFTPVNTGMVKELNLMKYGEHYGYNMELMKKELEEADIPVFDYTDSVDTGKFHDLFHMGPNGNKQVAEMLFQDVKSIIEEGLKK